MLLPRIAAGLVSVTLSVLGHSAANGHPARYELIGKTGHLCTGENAERHHQSAQSGNSRMLKAADVKEKILNTGTEVVAGTPDELAALIKSDTARMAKVFKDAGIKGD